jgi:hypothetical protein
MTSSTMRPCQTEVTDDRRSGGFSMYGDVDVAPFGIVFGGIDVGRWLVKSDQNFPPLTPENTGLSELISPTYPRTPRPVV